MTLDEIRAHPHFPFRRFREEDLEFLLLELYWVELFREIVGADQARNWTPLFPADREDGNPMLNLGHRGVSPLRKVRVIQRFNDTGLPELKLEDDAVVTFTDDAYVPFVPDLTYGAIDPDTYGPAEELLISSDISPACERLMHRFVRAWCVDLIPQAGMEAMLEGFWAGIRPRLVQVGGGEP